METSEIEERCKWFIDMLRRESEGENFSSMEDKNNFEYYCYRCYLVNQLKHNAEYVDQEEDDEDLTQDNENRQKVNDMVSEILSEGFRMNYDFYNRYKGAVDLILYHVVLEILEDSISLQDMFAGYKSSN